MKETHLFYVPQMAATTELPPDEAQHALRVLRMQEGDALWATDGAGTFCACHVVSTAGRRCVVQRDEQVEAPRLWAGGIHLAVAPTKQMERMEWLVEKATEIGLDSLTFTLCHNSERRVVKTERALKIAVAAMKQSHKARLPRIEGPMPLAQLLATPFQGQKFIAHCLSAEPPAAGLAALTRATGADRLLADVVSPTEPTLVLIGPEGDFTAGEVAAAQIAGFAPISLGRSRLRTETAALAAVHTMYLSKSRGPSAPQP